MELSKEQQIIAAAEKLVRCKGRYHSEQNYRALAALFGVTTPELPPLEEEQQPVLYASEETLAYAGQGEPVLKCISAPSGEAIIPLYLHPQQGKAIPDHMELIDKGQLTMFKNSHRTLLDYRADQVWYWQGDGDDHPETISCPVMMSAATLNDLIRRAEEKAVQVPDEVLKKLLPDAEKAEFWFEHEGRFLFEGVKFNDAVFDACRAAMLTSEPVRNRDELAEEVTEGMQKAKANLSQWLQEGKQIFDTAYLEDGNSPVIPDGWKLVPAEATAEMLWAAKYVMSSTVGWESFKEAYRAMIAAAPQGVPEMSKSEKFDIALRRAMENNKDTLAALAKK